MRRLSALWLTLRNRPIFLLGVMAGVVIFVLVIREGISIRNRTIRVEANTPCLNLTTRQCARKLLASLTPEERRQIQRRYQQDVRIQARARARRLERQRAADLRNRRGSRRHGGQRAGVGSPGRSPSPTSPGGGTRRPGSNPVTSPGVSPAPAPQPSPSPPSSNPPAPSPSPAPGPSVTSPNPIVQTPVISTPQIGPVGPIVIPSVKVPCVPAPPLVNCNS